MPGGLDWRQPGVYSQLPEGQKANSGEDQETACRVPVGLPLFGVRGQQRDGRQDGHDAEISMAYDTLWVRP